MAGFFVFYLFTVNIKVAIDGSPIYFYRLFMPDTSITPFYRLGYTIFNTGNSAYPDKVDAYPYQCGEDDPDQVAVILRLG